MASPPKKKLGKGLSALLGSEDNGLSSDFLQTKTLSGEQETLREEARIENIFPGTFQQRQVFKKAELEELAVSIKELGVLQPILVRTRNGHSSQYEIIAGERRWRAAQLAQIPSVPIIVKNFSDVEALEIGLVENLQRENLSPIEEAKGYKKLIDEFGHTQEKLGKILGKSRPHISNMLRLLNLPKVVRNMLLDGDLTVGHARALINSSDPEKVAKVVCSRGLNVRQTERLCKALDIKSNESQGRGSSQTKPADTLSLEKDISNILGLNVEITDQKGRGQVKVFYKDLDQLDDILFRLSAGAYGRSSKKEN